MAEQCTDSQQLKPAIGLPGVKLLEHEEPQDAIQRILDTKLRSFAEGLRFGQQVEQAEEISDSKSKFGLQTKYVKTIMRAFYGREDGHGLPEAMSDVMRAAVTQSSRRDRSELLFSKKMKKQLPKRREDNSCFPKKAKKQLSKQFTTQLHRGLSRISKDHVPKIGDFLNHVDMHMCTHEDGKRFLYGWLTDQEFSDLRTMQGEEALAEWCTSRLSQQVQQQNDLQCREQVTESLHPPRVE
eukprot:gnl/MRDRNA2_/MRDRNA2_254432_c0_seq1.p1 gnl/MRDRNA2_/MRDRNA2_254432_c0~~gnl/MRDRNA2_/MRDRNA2_254432_c0_seq1.p1  ORF type:complete len:263 (+),score=46.30 gnl/MRDRNA2_/MRDRNA2_254432_c0_seq1:71-790(+)